MRSLLVASLFISAALLAGCAASKEHEVEPYVPMPKDMDTTTGVPEPAKVGKASEPAAPSSAVVGPASSASGSW